MPQLCPVCCFSFKSDWPANHGRARHRASAEHQAALAERARRWAVESFWARVDRSSPYGCWPWLGRLYPAGYGECHLFGEGYAHRIAYILTRGPIPKGLQIDHLCRNRACANPEHLEAVTQRENILRGTGASARNAVKTHCIRGHEFTPENTYREPTGGRRCRTCFREWDRRRSARGARPRRGAAKRRTIATQNLRSDPQAAR